MAGLSGTARRAGHGSLVFYAVCRAIVVGCSYLFFPGRTEGRERLPAGGAFVVAPAHRSYVDWLIVARVSRRRLCYIVKGEVWRSRLSGALLEALGAFPVRRDAPDREALHRALAVLDRGEPLVVFPEGTRGSGPVIGELREGAAYLAIRAGVPVVPVGLAGTEAVMARGTKLPRPGRVRVVIGAPIAPPVAPVGERLGRNATHAFSEAIRAGIQDTFDDATRRLASSPAPGRSPRPASDAATTGASDAGAGG